MARTLGLLIAVLLVAAGVLFTLQGLDVLEGSAMSGSSFWAIAGPVIAGLGVALGYVVARGQRT